MIPRSVSARSPSPVGATSRRSHGSELDTADMVFTVQVDGACRVVASVEYHYAGHRSSHRGSRSKHKWYGMIMKSRPLGSEAHRYQSPAGAIATSEWCRHQCQPVASQCGHAAAPENTSRLVIIAIIIITTITTVLLLLLLLWICTAAPLRDYVRVCSMRPVHGSGNRQNALRSRAYDRWFRKTARERRRRPLRPEYGRYARVD